jgi:YidC/Oxa1 family membrane protein insertase
LNVKLVFLLALLFVGSASARVEFGVREFSAADLRNPQLLDELCAEQSVSFWCETRDATLQLITTKGADYLFSDAGEIVALYAKQQRGQDFRGNYALDNNQNLIPYTAPHPGGAVLFDGQYYAPQEVTSTWEETTHADAPALRGTFSYTVDEIGAEVTKVVTVSAVLSSMDVSIEVTRTGPGEATVVQYAFPGIARQNQPALKVGQGETFTLNPPAQAFPAANYISLQSNNRNTGFALVLRPRPGVPEAGEGLVAFPLSATQIALGRTLAPEVGALAALELQAYGGPNEMVRFSQENYLELPGLFRPNLLGRLSLGIIVALQAIYSLVGSWGLAIILLTLLFRALVWPLISAQTKSMVGMQKIQPKMQELQKKYKNDREKLTQETMKLYQEAGVNPAGGCLPVLVQMPIFIILWRVFINFEFNEGFLWIPDLGLSDPFYLLPLLYVAVMVGQSVVASKGNTQMLRQQLLISGVFVFFIFGFPAGVTLYLITSMLIQVLQQWLIQRNMDAAPATLATGVTPVPSPPSAAAIETAAQHPATREASSKAAGTKAGTTAGTKAGTKAGKARTKKVRAK